MTFSIEDRTLLVPDDQYVDYTVKDPNPKIGYFVGGPDDETGKIFKSSFFIDLSQLSQSEKKKRSISVILISVKGEEKKAIIDFSKYLTLEMRIRFFDNFAQDS